MEENPVKQDLFLKPKDAGFRLIGKGGENMRNNILVNVLLSIITVLAVSVLYLLYQNRMAEDMIRELNQNYEGLAAEVAVCEGKKE